MEKVAIMHDNSYKYIQTKRKNQIFVIQMNLSHSHIGHTHTNKIKKHLNWLISRVNLQLKIELKIQLKKESVNLKISL